MANAIASKYSMGYVLETVQGTTPASPLKAMRLTSGVGQVNQSFAESDEIQLFEVPNAIRTSAEGSIDIAGELSYGLLDDFLAAIFQQAVPATWNATNILAVGNTPVSMTIEDQWNDITKFMPYKGCVIEGLDINLAQGSKITFKAKAKAMTPPTAAAATTAGTGAQTAAPTNDVMDPIGSVQLAQEGGAGSLLTGAPGLTALSMSFSRAAIMEPQLGSTAQAGLGSGRFVMKGSFSTYFANSTILDKWLGDTTTSLSFTLGGSAAKKYNFLFSKVYLTDGGPSAVSKDAPVIQTYSFQAVYDPTNTTCKVTRTP